MRISLALTPGAAGAPAGGLAGGPPSGTGRGATGAMGTAGPRVCADAARAVARAAVVPARKPRKRRRFIAWPPGRRAPTGREAPRAAARHRARWRVRPAAARDRRRTFAVG